MKLRLVLVVLFILPLMVKGQAYKPTYVSPSPNSSNDPKKGVIFYSKGKMYVKYKDGAPKGETTSTTLYIDGSAKFASDASIDQKGRTEITGDFVNAKNPDVDVAATSANLFVNLNATSDKEKEGVVAFVGDNPRQWIYGVVNTIGGTSEDWNGKEQKAVNYMRFPTISVEKPAPATTDDWRNAGVLVLDPSVSAEINYLNVNTDNNNRFAVKASNTTPTTDRDRIYINSGHALIRNLHPSLASSSEKLATYSQVYLDLYNYDGSTVDDGRFINEASEKPGIDPSTNGKSLRTGSGHPQNAGWNYLVGFSSPFEQLGADYMFYNVLTKPNGNSITSNEGPIVDPLFRMQKGKGYFISMEVSHADHDGDINNRWDFEKDYVSKMTTLTDMGRGINSERRARGGYVFNRKVFHDFLSAPQSSTLASTSPEKGSMDNLSRFVYKAPINATDVVHPHTDPRDIRPFGGLSAIGNVDWMDDGKDRSRYEVMDKETFNVGEVKVQLEAGLNFLGNPFMAPISLNPLLGLNVDGTDKGYTNTVLSEGFNVDELGGVKVSTEKAINGVQLRSKYWVINQALVRYEPTKNIFEYKATYDFLSRDGASAVFENGTIGSGGSTTAPADSYYTKTFDASKYLISPMQMFCLQAAAPVEITLKPSLQTLSHTARIPKSASLEKSAIMKDWFIVEAESEKTKVTDRATVIFRQNAKHFEDVYDTEKGISKHEQIVDTYRGKATKTAMVENTGIVYTKASGGKALLGNAVPADTKELALFFVPPATTQEMTLRFYGIDNVESVQGVWLVDRYLDNKVLKIEEGSEYKFVANASGTDTKDAHVDNRFLLLFYDRDGSSTEIEDTEMSCYYNSSTLHIRGLSETDIDSDMHVYDLQGRLVGRKKVDNVSMDYVKPLSLGTYIVKVTGKRNHTAKFVNTGK